LNIGSEPANVKTGEPKPADALILGSCGIPHPKTPGTAMSEKVKVLYYVLWFGHPVLQTVIAGLMLWHGLQRKFKYFLAYILTQLVSFGLVFSAWGYTGNFYLYWVCNAFSVAFGFGVIYEVFVDVFRSFHTLRDLGSVLFKWAGLVMLLVAGVVSVSANASDIPPWMQAIITAQRCVRIVQVGMVLFLLFFAQYLGLNRRAHSFGIALGFGSFSLVELVLLASWVGNHLANPWMSMVNMTAYNASMLIWIGYLAVKNPVKDTGTMLLQPQRWEQSLSDIHHPVSADSLIPMFEGMVDRALSRRQSEPTPIPEKAAGAAAGAGSSAIRLSARWSSKT
jgi:hypothetical protein